MTVEHRGTPEGIFERLREQLATGEVVEVERTCSRCGGPRRPGRQRLCRQCHAADMRAVRARARRAAPPPPPEPALTVVCPLCRAQVGVRCRGNATHVSRATMAALLQ